MQRDKNLSPSRYIFLIEQGQIRLLPLSSPNVKKCFFFFSSIFSTFLFCISVLFIACGFPVENVPKM